MCARNKYIGHLKSVADAGVVTEQLLCCTLNIDGLRYVYQLTDGLTIDIFTRSTQIEDSITVVFD